MSKNILGFSELTGRVYCLKGREKTDVTEEFIDCMTMFLLHAPDNRPKAEIKSITRQVFMEEGQFEITIKKIKPVTTTIK